MRALHFYSRSSAFILFFFMSFISFFFLGVDAEYNLNQQIDRGFISRNSVFFAFDFSDGQRSNLNLTADGILEPSVLDEQTGENNRLAENDIAENQMSYVENILVSGGTDYFSAVHVGKGRYVYFQGKVQLPPILSGRFFTTEECLSRTPLAVIGKELEIESFYENEKKYIILDGIKCEVIGIAGMEHDSTIDRIYFINIGAIPMQMQLGRFYIDGLGKMDIVYDRLSAASMKWMHVPLRKLDIPMTFTDAVSGNIYLKQYIKVVVVLLLGFIYVSILNQAITAERRKTGIMKVIGLTPTRVIKKIQLPLFISGTVGIITTLIVGMLLVAFRYFALPNAEVINLLIRCCAVSASMLAIWFLVFLASDNFISLREETQRL